MIPSARCPPRCGNRRPRPCLQHARPPELTAWLGASGAVAECLGRSPAETLGPGRPVALYRGPRGPAPLPAAAHHREQAYPGTHCTAVSLGRFTRTGRAFFRPVQAHSASRRQASFVVVSQSRRQSAGQDTIPAANVTRRMGSWRSTSFRALRAHYKREYPGRHAQGRLSMRTCLHGAWFKGSRLVESVLYIRVTPEPLNL
jgi:hypothetical protein